MKTKVIDYLAEELKAEQKQQAKRERMKKLLTGLKAKTQPALVVDYLGSFGD
jgi:hypothetical protein